MSSDTGPPSKKMKVCRQYNEEFILLGFVKQSDSNKPVCVECGLVMSNDSMKKAKLEIHQKTKHPSSVGKDKKYFELKLKSQPVKLADFFKRVNASQIKTLKPSYMVSEIIAKVGAPQGYGEKLIKPSMLACADELLSKEAVSVLEKIPLSRATVTRRQDEMSAYIEEKLVEIPQNTKFSLQIDETTIHNEALLLSYVTFFHENDVREEMLFLKSLPETTSGKDIFMEVHKYFIDKKIPLENLIQVSTDGAPSMTGRNKGFITQMKTVAPHILHVHCIIHRQHLASKNIGGNMEQALEAAVSGINFIKANSLNERLFQNLCDEEEFKKLLLHTEVRWLSKGNSLDR